MKVGWIDEAEGMKRRPRIVNQRMTVRWNSAPHPMMLEGDKHAAPERQADQLLVFEEDAEPTFDPWAQQLAAMNREK